MNYKKFPIRRITKGDLVRTPTSNGMSYCVGDKFRRGSIIIVEIAYDEEYFYKTSEPRYHLFIQGEDDAPELLLWKTVTGRDVTVEYDLDSQKIH